MSVLEHLEIGKRMTTHKRNMIALGCFIFSFILMRLLLSSNSSCVDGFISSSIGTRGACSHHGGVKSGMGSGLVALFFSAAISYIIVKFTKITISPEEVRETNKNFKNEYYNLADKICNRCGGRVRSTKLPNDKFPYWACENIKKGKCDARPIKKHLK